MANAPRVSRSADHRRAVDRTPPIRRLGAKLVELISGCSGEFDARWPARPQQSRPTHADAASCEHRPHGLAEPGTVNASRGDEEAEGLSLHCPAGDDPKGIASLFCEQAHCWRHQIGALQLRRLAKPASCHQGQAAGKAAVVRERAISMELVWRARLHCSKSDSRHPTARRDSCPGDGNWCSATRR